MVEIVSTSIQRRVTVKRVTRSTAGQAPPPVAPIEYVVAKVGVPGRDGHDGLPGGLPPFGGPGSKLVHRRSRDDGGVSERP
ncbi:hypothetical protein [Methylobacterium sp. WL2]|uniref:hypothetical protein n=1 Tax=Methylobacterium sp. WL2 TaxID=2603902 RepID=UPI001650C41C|nr:hypothetical protein [Methylobacterium sp. WL2]